MRYVRTRVGVRRDYESLYALGLAVTAYAAAESMGGSGFLAAFAAGFTVAAQDVELCDCFLEYGEATAEMLLLLTFVALGLSVVWSGLTIIDWSTLLFAAVALFARTMVLMPLLNGVGLQPRERQLIALFGPRGLSSLLYVLLAVFAGVSGAADLFAVTCLVVLLSVIVHGGGMALFLRRHHMSARALRCRRLRLKPVPTRVPDLSASRSLNCARCRSAAETSSSSTRARIAATARMISRHRARSACPRTIRCAPRASCG